MTDTKLDPRSLREKAEALVTFTREGSLFIAWVQAVTDALAPASEGGKVESEFDEVPQQTMGELVRRAANEAKVECPNCGKGVHRSTDHCSMDQGPHGPLAYDCQPARPEPVAAEMPEAVRNAVNSLRACASAAKYPSILVERADALESFWRTHAAQPANAEKIRQDGFDDGYLAGRTYERTFSQPAPAVAMTETQE